jgi:hypothetical protein
MRPILWDRVRAAAGSRSAGCAADLCRRERPLAPGYLAKAGLIGMSIAFLVVGIIVSVKIGGGSNLHNVDMFLIGLLFAGMLAWEAGLREWILNPSRSRLASDSSHTDAGAIPCLERHAASPALNAARPAAYRITLRTVQTYVTMRLKKGRSSFSINANCSHLDTSDVPLVPEYEKKLVMDHAMAEDEPI